ncbi:hypothetical protein B0H13DRAFT_1920887 [Mycena leptocephala]|nr:hypothetical protein B0H13DRAFT_1920887 [Mycena leptocephala]
MCYSGWPQCWSRSDQDRRKSVLSCHDLLRTTTSAIRENRLARLVKVDALRLLSAKMRSDKGCQRFVSRDAIFDPAEHQRSATEPARLRKEDEQTGCSARAVETEPDAFSFISLNDSGASSYHSAMIHPAIAGSSSSDCLEHLLHLKLSRVTTCAFHVFSRPPSPLLLNENSASSLLFHPVASVGSRSSSATGLGQSAGSGPDYQSFWSAGAMLIEGPTTPIWSWDTQRKFHQMLPIASLSPPGFPVTPSSKCFAADTMGSVGGNVHFVGQASGFRNPSSIFPNPPSNMSLLCCVNPNGFNDTSSEFPTTVISPLDVTIRTITSLDPTSLDASMFGTPRSLELSPEHEAHLGDMASLDLGLDCIGFEF